MSGGDVINGLYRRGERCGHQRFHRLGSRPLETVINRLAMKFGVVNDGGWEEQLNLAAEQNGLVVADDLRTQIVEAIDICESPIEKHLLPWLLMQHHWLFDYPPILLRSDRLKIPKNSIGVVPQLRIGQFRVDFALVWKHMGRLMKGVIECDGAEYHSDEAKDIARSGNLLKIADVLVIRRFTGSEIYSRPDACAYLAAASVHGACNSLRMGLNK